MTPSQGTVPTSRTIRLIHAAMITGVLLFAVVGHFVLRPAMADAGELPPIIVRTLLGVALGACALSLMLRRRVPQRSSGESADLYWARATTPSLLTWAPLEGASLLAIFLYARTGAPTPVAVGAIAVLLFVVLNPGHLEGR